MFLTRGGVAEVLPLSPETASCVDSAAQLLGRVRAQPSRSAFGPAADVHAPPLPAQQWR